MCGRVPTMQLSASRMVQFVSAPGLHWSWFETPVWSKAGTSNQVDVELSVDCQFQHWDCTRASSGLQCDSGALTDNWLIVPPSPGTTLGACPRAVLCSQHQAAWQGLCHTFSFSPPFFHVCEGFQVFFL